MVFESVSLGANFTSNCPINFRHAFGCNGPAVCAGFPYGDGNACDGPRSDRGHGLGGAVRDSGWVPLQVRLSSTGTAREVEVIGLGVTPDGDVLHTPQRVGVPPSSDVEVSIWLCRHLMPPRWRS